MAGEAHTKNGIETDAGHVPGPDGGTGNAQRPGGQRPGRRRPLPGWRAAAITAALAGVACLAAACSSPQRPAGNRLTNAGAQALAYSKCMRSHGIRDYPDPVIHGNGVGMGVSTRGDLNPSSPTFKAASQACKSLQPAGANPPQQTAQQLAGDVKFADCMRSHGYPGFPDPDSRGVFKLPRAMNPGSAQFGSATNACQKQTNIHSLNMSGHGPGGGS